MAVNQALLISSSGASMVQPYVTRASGSQQSLEGTTVESPHPDFKMYADTWQRIRDCMAGVDQVKRQGVTYLPQLTDQEPADYQIYKRRAKFVNFTKATIEMMHGFIFKRDPKREVPDDLEDFMNDCTLGGKPWDQFEKDVVMDCIAMGRRGTLVDWSLDENAPYCAPYSAEQIVNWKTMRYRGEMVLSLLVLQEDVPAPEAEHPTAFSHESISQWRVYRLDMEASEEGEPMVICDVYQRGEKDKFIKVSTDIPSRRGDSLHRIPFVFHGSVNTECEINPPPMGDISDLNIKHYCLSADLENGRHFCGLPTPYAICFDLEDGENLRVGASLAWTTENPQAKVGYLEFHGDGLKTLETGIVETEEQLAALGARMLEKQKGDEAYQTVLMRQSGQMAALIGIAESCSASLTLVMQWAEWWLGTAKDPEDYADTVEIDMNSDFVDVQLTRGEIQEMWQTCMQGGISRQTFHEFLQKAEVIPADRDLEEELALIAAQPPPGMLPMGQPLPQPKAQPIQQSTKKQPGTTGGGAQEGAQGEPASAEPGAKPKGAGNSPNLTAYQITGTGTGDRGVGG
jgi:hypothetical protein